MRACVSKAGVFSGGGAGGWVGGGMVVSGFVCMYACMYDCFMYVNVKFVKGQLTMSVYK